MAIADDFTVTVGGDIRTDSPATTYTVLELHRWLQDLADDDAAGSDDLLDITSSTPSERSTDNIITLNSPYNIDDAAAEWFYDGSITQDAGDTVYSGLVVVGSLASTTTLKIVQNNLFYDDQDAPFWGTDLNALTSANILMRCIVLTRTGGADVDSKKIRVQARTHTDTYAEFGVTMGLGNSTAAIFTNDDLNNQNVASNIDDWDVEITNTEGYQDIDIDEETTDEDYYSQWAISATPGEGSPKGNINDLYEFAKALTRANHDDVVTIHGIDPELFRGITHSVAYDGQDASEFFTEDEVIDWGTGTGLLLADTEAGSDSGTTGTMYIQLLTGVAPVENDVLAGATCNADATATITSRTLSPCFVGTTTGSNLIAAYGIGVAVANTSVGDQYFPLDDTGPILPKNNQTFTVSGLIDSEDRVLVGPRGYVFDYDNEATGPFTLGETLTFGTPAGTAVLADFVDRGDFGQMIIGPILSGTVPTDDSTIAGASATADVDGTVKNAIDTRQYTLNGLLNGGTVTAVVVTETIPSDTTPSTGTIRIKRTSGKYTRHPYSAASGNTFTITSHSFVADPAVDDTNVFISYIDEDASGTSATFTAVYVSTDRDLLVRVRDGGGAPKNSTPIKTFETASTFSSGGGSVSAIRTSDE